MSTAQNVPLRSRQYWMVAIGAGSIMMSAAFGTTGLSFFVGPVTSEFGFERSAFTITSSLITIVGVVGMPIAGKLVPRLGARKLIVVGGLVAALGVVALSASSELWQFYASSLLMGIGFSSTIGFIPVVLVNMWFVKKKGLILGLVLSSTGISGALLSMLLPNFLMASGWRAGYLLIAVLIAVFTVVPGLFLITDTPASVGLEPFGAAAVDPNIVAAPAEGLTYKQALSSPPFYLIYVAVVLLGMTHGLITHLPVYFTDSGYDAAAVGQLMATLTLGITVAKVIMGWMNDKLGLVATLIITAALHAVSLLILPLGVTVIIAMLSMALMAFGNGSGTVLPPLVASRALGGREFAAIWGILATAYSVGFAVGQPLWGVVFDTTGSYELGLLISPAILAVAILSAVAGMRAGRRRIALNSSDTALSLEDSVPA